MNEHKYVDQYHSNEMGYNNRVQWHWCLLLNLFYEYDLKIVNIFILFDKKAICVDDPPRRINPSVCLGDLKLSSRKFTVNHSSIPSSVPLNVLTSSLFANGNFVVRK